MLPPLGKEVMVQTHATTAAMLIESRAPFPDSDMERYLRLQRTFTRALFRALSVYPSFFHDHTLTTTRMMMKENSLVSTCIEADSSKEWQDQVMKRVLDIQAFKLSMPNCPHQGEIIKSRTSAWVFDNVLTEEQCL